VQSSVDAASSEVAAAQTTLAAAASQLDEKLLEQSKTQVWALHSFPLQLYITVKPSLRV